MRTDRNPFSPLTLVPLQLLLMMPLVLLGVASVTPAHAQVSVRVAPLDELLVESLRRAPAEVLPLNDSVIAAEVNAVVASVNVDVGMAVRQGDVLVELDDRDFRLQVEAAEASLAAAEAQRADAAAKLERALSLSRERYVSADELLTRETALALGDADQLAARSQLDIARRNLDKCRILAPFDGVVQQRDAQVGAYVTVGTPVLRLTQLDRLELAAEVPAAIADGLRETEAAWFESRGERWPVALLRLSPVVDPGRRSRQARFSFVDDTPAAGRSGQLVWREAGGQLPASLLSRRDGRLGVFVHRDGRAEFQPVPGAEEGRPASLTLPGLTEIVVQGRERLQDGDAISLR